jgi:hypothetical protein
MAIHASRMRHEFSHLVEALERWAWSAIEPNSAESLSSSLPAGPAYPSGMHNAAATANNLAIAKAFKIEQGRSITPDNSWVHRGFRNPDFNFLTKYVGCSGVHSS